MTTGPDNYDQWLERYETVSKDERRDIGWGVCFLAIVLIGGVLLLNSTEPLPPPCTASQTAACIDRLPLR